MAKKVIDHLEEIYKEELDSHDIIKTINNDNNMPIKLDNYFFKKKNLIKILNIFKPMLVLEIH